MGGAVQLGRAFSSHNSRDEPEEDEATAKCPSCSKQVPIRGVQAMGEAWTIKYPGAMLQLLPASTKLIGPSGGTSHGIGVLMESQLSIMFLGMNMHVQ